MENPFRSEAAAFRFLLLTIGAFALIVVAALINRWLGLAVFVLLSAAAIGLYLRQRGERPPQQQVAHLSPPDEHRVLVIANETVGGEELMEEIGELALAGQTNFHVVCPALNSRLKTWTSDSDAAREAAQQRLDATLRRLGDVGIEATGEVGDLDPLVAIEDAIRTFHPNEIVISTHPYGKSNWLERGVVRAARERFDLNVTHVVVDLEAQARVAEAPESARADSDPAENR